MIGFRPVGALAEELLALGTDAEQDYQSGIQWRWVEYPKVVEKVMERFARGDYFKFHPGMTTWSPPPSNFAPSEAPAHLTRWEDQIRWHKEIRALYRDEADTALHGHAGLIGVFLGIRRIGQGSRKVCYDIPDAQTKRGLRQVRMYAREFLRWAQPLP